jgi:starvation-inducible outer membrane lipoprotein
MRFCPGGLALVFVAVSLLLGGCTTVPGQTDRQATLSDLLLVFDSSEKMG